MKIIRKIFLIVFPAVTFICFFACNELPQTQDQDDTIHLKFEPNKPPISSKLSDIVANVRLIPLETNPDCYINTIGRVFVGAKNILVMTPGARQYLYLYTLDGRFIRKIGNPGKGPGEYTDIRDISVYEEENQVYISSGLKGDMMVYNFDGSFIRTIKGIQGASESKRVGKNKTAYYSHYDYEVKVVDEEIMDTLGYIPIDLRYKSPLAKVSGSVHGGFFFYAVGKDTIWRFTQDSLVPKIICDFGSGSMTFNEYYSAIASGSLPAGKILIAGFPFYGPGFYHFLLRREDSKGEYNNYDLIVNDKTHEYYHVKLSSESDDILFASAVFFRNSTYTGEMVTAASAIDLKEGLPKIKKNKDFKYDSKIISQIEQLRDDDNPVLVLFTLK